MTGSIEGSHRRRPVDDPTSRAAARTWWDAEADAYQREHEAFLGAASWVWGPEGWDDTQLDLLQAKPGSRALELGCGAAAGARWLVDQGVLSVGLDLSYRMLQHAQRLNEETDVFVPVVQAHAAALPFAGRSFELVATSYGALPFVADVEQVLAEVERVLVPGGRAVLATTHPVRWAFPDDAGRPGLTVVRPYFDRTPYVESDEAGRVGYVEHHRTVGDWVDLVVGAGLILQRLVEPPWSQENSATWGGWSPLRGSLIPGTLIIVAQKPV